MKKPVTLSHVGDLYINILSPPAPLLGITVCGKQWEYSSVLIADRMLFIDLQLRLKLFQGLATKPHPLWCMIWQTERREISVGVTLQICRNFMNMRKNS